MSYKIKIKQIEGDIGNGLYQSEKADGVYSTALGGAESKDAFYWKTRTLSQVFDELLFPYKAPAMTLTVSGASTLEVGQALAATLTFTWTSTNPSNVQANSVSIIDVTNSNTTLLSGQAASGADSYTYGTAIVKNSVSSHQWKAQGTNSNSAQYFTTATKSWYWRKYWGSSASGTANEALIESLQNSALSSSNAGTYTMPAGDYKYFAFPASNGVPTSFISGGLPFALADSTDGYTLGSGNVTYKQVTVTNGYGQSTTYNVFRSKWQPVQSVSVIVS